MSVTVDLTHEYDYPAELVWHVATDFAYFECIMRGLISFKNLPEGQLVEGQEIDLEVSLFGKLPYQPYSVHIIKYNKQERTFISSEKGAGVRSWVHELKVIADEAGDGCKICEQIKIDAGILTPVFAAWARFLYKKRHPRRLDLLAELEISGE